MAALVQQTSLCGMLCLHSQGDLLQKTFKLQGRSHEWGRTGAPDEACNPGHSKPLKTLLTGNLKTFAAAAAGQEPKGAVSFTQKVM